MYNDITDETYDDLELKNIERESGGEIFAFAAYGLQNTYLGNCKSDSENNTNIINSKKYAVGTNFISKKDVHKYLNELEEHNMEKNLENLDNFIESDLQFENSNYSERLKFSLENNSAEIEMCYENIIKTKNIWDGENNNYNQIELTENSIYDIYLKIEKISCEFVQSDIVNLSNLTIGLITKTNYLDDRVHLHEADLFTCCLSELLKGNDIQPEPNILYFKCFDFNKSKFGLHYGNDQQIKLVLPFFDKFKRFNQLDPLNTLNPSNQTKEKFNDYKIDVIISSKNILQQVLNYEQRIISHQINDFINVTTNKRIKFSFCENPVSLIFCSFINKKNIDAIDLHYNDDEINMRSINVYLNSSPHNDDEINMRSIKMYLNSSPLIFYKEELVKINFCGITTFVICIDLKLKNKKLFCSYMKGEFDYQTLKSINFSRIDKIELSFNYDSEECYDLHVNCLNMKLMTFYNDYLNFRF